MKSTFLLSVLVIFFITTHSQTKDYSTFSLGVEKEYSTYKKVFVFKPDKALKIMTLDKMKYKSEHYTFSEKFIVMDMKDTILFDNISRIQGQVYNDGARKALGVFVTIAAVPFLIVTIGEGIVNGDPVAFVVAIPFIGMGYGGLRLIGPRKFRISQDCYVTVFEQKKP